MMLIHCIDDRAVTLCGFQWMRAPTGDYWITLADWPHLRDRFDFDGWPLLYLPNMRRLDEKSERSPDSPKRCTACTQAFDELAA